MSFTALLLAVTIPALARADVAAYVQGRGTAGGDSASELMPGGTEPALGTALGWRIGARLLFLEGFADHHAFGDDASISRGILGVTGGVSLADLRLRAGAGVGVLRSTGGAFDMPGDRTDADGPVARAAVALDYSLGYGFWLGFELETSVFRLAPADSSLADDAAQNGSAILGSLQLGFELGL